MLKKLTIRVGLPIAIVGGFIIGHLDIQDHSPHPQPPHSRSYDQANGITYGPPSLPMQDDHKGFATPTDPFYK